MEYSRPAKLSHSQTILYEIDMLRTEADLLAKGQFQREPEMWAHLECFLLHYRNLLEFFGKEPTRDDDLSVRRPEIIWGGTVPDRAVLDRMWRPDPYAKYEDQRGTDSRRTFTISRYLQHCTEQRIEPHSWKIKEMFEDLEPVLLEFENSLPNKERPWKEGPRRITFLSDEAMSTATFIRYKV